MQLGVFRQKPHAFKYRKIRLKLKVKTKEEVKKKEEKRFSPTLKSKFAQVQCFFI